MNTVTTLINQLNTGVSQGVHVFYSGLEPFSFKNVKLKNRHLSDAKVVYESLCIHHKLLSNQYFPLSIITTD